MATSRFFHSTAHPVTAAVGSSLWKGFIPTNLGRLVVLADRTELQTKRLGDRLAHFAAALGAEHPDPHTGAALRLRGGHNLQLDLRILDEKAEVSLPRPPFGPRAGPFATG